jgi:hypothetical protein
MTSLPIIGGIIVSSIRISALDQVTGNYPMEVRSIVETVSTKGHKVLDRQRGSIRKEFDDKITSTGFKQYLDRISLNPNRRRGWAVTAAAWDPEK